MKAGEVAFVGCLARGIPELMGSLQEHLDDYEGLLPHVWLGEVTRWGLKRFTADPADPAVVKMLEFMEQALSRESSEAEHELVAASFVENLPRRGDTRRRDP